MSETHLVRPLSWRCAPLHLMRFWRTDLPLLSLVSGGEPTAHSRFSVFAPRRECVRVNRQQHGCAHLRTALDNVGSPCEPIQCGETTLPFAGGWIGFVGYECGAMFEPTARLRDGAGSLSAGSLWSDAVLCDVPRAAVYCHTTERWFDVGESRGEGPNDWIDTSAAMRPLRFEVRRALDRDSAAGRASFESMVERTRELILAGDIFQANITRGFRAGIAGSPRALALHALADASPRHGAFLELDAHTALLSLSPELFLSIDGASRRIATRPMKGTRPAGQDPEELRTSTKDAAELHMIVDLMRNDLGRVCEIGSVTVAEQRTIEHHSTVLQSVAEISGRLPRHLPLSSTFAACFPPGSVTGAPKVRAMQVIDALEAGPRSAYCGAIGMASRCGSSHFSVAIRTARLTRDAGDRWDIDYHAGCGIVAESNAADEHLECIAKTQVFVNALTSASQRSSEHFGGDARELAPLRLGESDMTCDPMTLHALDEMRQSIAGGVEVGVVDLPDVAAQHDLGSVANS
jgi:anthranilate/para-aminobenzoate synthase component I